MARVVATSRRGRLDVRLGSGNYNRIARNSGVSPEHVSRVLRGLRRPSFTVAAQISRAAGVSLDDLNFYIGAPPPVESPVAMEAVQ